MTLRDSLRFRGEPTDITLEDGRYTLRYQTIDDRKHSDELKAEGDAYPLLIEIFDKGVLTYERRFGFRDNTELRSIIDICRREIEMGTHAAKKSHG